MLNKFPTLIIIGCYTLINTESSSTLIFAKKLKNRGEAEFCTTICDTTQG